MDCENKTKNKMIDDSLPSTSLLSFILGIALVSLLWIISDAKESPRVRQLKQDSTALHNALLKANTQLLDSNLHKYCFTIGRDY